jgi:hypothetical protein
MTLFAALTAAVFALANIWPLLALLLLAMGVHVFRSTRDTATGLRGQALAEGVLVEGRADREHALALAGDERGVYGGYPPEEGF